MASTPQVLAAIVLVTLFLIAVVMRRPPLGTRSTLGNHATAFAAIAALPILVTWFGFENHLEGSKSTSFCLSCHVMEPYGESLWIDDEDGHVPATHFQNKRVPQEQACFVCHTQYTMFGDLQAKIQGMRHLYVYYFGTVPETIELYQPYQNRECLFCHAGARVFEQSELHAEMRAELEANETSCLECHGPAHDIENLADLERWSGVLSHD